MDKRLPLSFYYRIANEIVKEAEARRELGDSEGLCQALIHYSRIVSEVIPQHPSYSGKSNEMLDHKKILQQFTKELKTLNSRIAGTGYNSSFCSMACHKLSESGSGNCHICDKDTYWGVRETTEYRTVGTHGNNDLLYAATETTSDYSKFQASLVNPHFNINMNYVKHYFPSPALSCVEAPPVIGRVSQFTFSEPNNVDAQSSEMSSTSKALKGLHISAGLMEEFMELAKANTMKDMETCGILGASLSDNTYYITTLVMPKQESTANSCQALNEEEILAILDGESLYPAGWIHTHPSQTCFLSSIDLHTQYSYQVMLPEAVAIVMAPTDAERKSGIFRLTDPGGIDVLRQCQESGFHSHPETADGSPLYVICSDVRINPSLRFEIFDMRLQPSD